MCWLWVKVLGVTKKIDYMHILDSPYLLSIWRILSFLNRVVRDG